MNDRGEKGDQGDQGKQGIQGGQGKQGIQGGQGLPGVNLTVAQLESYVRRLEGRYRKIARLLTAALAMVSVVLLATLVFTAAELDARVEASRENRRAQVIGICEAVNETNGGIIEFLEEVSTPERVALGKDTFPIRNCPAEVRGLRVQER